MSQAEAYQQFRQEFASNEPIVKYTAANQIPASFEVRLKNTEADALPVSQVVNGYPGVAEVVDDSSILSGFYKLLDGARNAVVIIAIFLLVAAILLVANTIRLSAFNRRRETSIMRLVGASNFYVQLPFLVEGMIAGLVRLAGRHRPAHPGEVGPAGQPAAHLPVRRVAEHGRPGGGDHRCDDHRAADLRRHLVPDAQALPARLTLE